jgi:alkyl hydroperoxide reductase subunit AhpC
MKKFKKLVMRLSEPQQTANCHRAWMRTPRTDGGLGEIDLPLLADPTHAISKVKP